MKTYSFVLAIFTVVMTSIIGSQINNIDELVKKSPTSLPLSVSSGLHSFTNDKFNTIESTFVDNNYHILNKPALLNTHILPTSIWSISNELIKGKSLPIQIETHPYTLTTDFLKKTNRLSEKEHLTNKKADTKNIASDIAHIIPRNTTKTTPEKTIKQKSTAIAKVSYWDTVHSIESKQGKLLYRPRNKSKNCTYTHSPCGHHQLTVNALKDIGCKSLQCRKDRLIYSKSLAMSKKLLAKNENRLKKSGYQNLEDYQRYLIHQQGASGIKRILKASKGEKLLSKTIKQNMANNSPYSYKELSRMGSRLAANIFMNHWKTKWEEEKLLIAGQSIASTNTSIDQVSEKSFSLPLFNENEIRLALNYKF